MYDSYERIEEGKILNINKVFYSINPTILSDKLQYYCIRGIPTISFTCFMC